MSVISSLPSLVDTKAAFNSFHHDWRHLLIYELLFFLYKLTHNLNRCTDYTFCGHHFLSQFVMNEAIFLALAQFESCLQSSDWLIFDWLFLQLGKQLSVDTRPDLYVSLKISEMWAVIHKSETRLPDLG